ncbi:hypothetical protein ARMSODRAFT_978753 [Armillaria solidipes]|uniref:Uncharacterized protein n=1 Tax=Armillaria solidipes TaxID=1076256 RepID=A0A2H3BP00_9AGAR|nr:hypothetical protein ARMSODRAFT_978753 [Armillaria solidipes]
MAYDSSCKLLWHIITQDPNDHWLSTTKFIVDAWHYIGHKATDVLCRFWCNPSLSDGSQPDLVQMSNINYNFYIHSLMLLYKERVEQRIQKKDRGLTQEFWDDVLE